MKVLVACEESGTVRDAFRKLGHDAYSCDILPNDSPYHIQDDVLNHINNWFEKWDLMIAHPPCTRLCNSGVMWLDKRDLWNELKEAWQFFNKLKSADIEKICVENPIPHKYAREHIGQYTQLIQPWQFGHGETKATCLWLKGLQPLKPSNIVEGREQRLHKLPPSKDRARLRSKTYQGIADAMANQWGQVTLRGKGND